MQWNQSCQLMVLCHFWLLIGRPTMPRGHRTRLRRKLPIPHGIEQAWGRDRKQFTNVDRQTASLDLAGGGADNVHENGKTGHHEGTADPHENDGAKESEGRSDNSPPPHAQAEDYSAKDQGNNCASHELSPLQISKFLTCLY